MSTTRPFKNTRTVEEWNRDVIESASLDVLPASYDGSGVTVSWQQVFTEARKYDGFTGSADDVRRLLDDDELDLVRVTVVEEGYRLEKDV